MTQVKLVDQLSGQFRNFHIHFNDIVVLNFSLHFLKLFLIAHALVELHNRNAGKKNVIVTDTLESGDRFGVTVEGMNENIGITKDHRSEIIPGFTGLEDYQDWIGQISEDSEDQSGKTSSVAPPPFLSNLLKVPGAT